MQLAGNWCRYYITIKTLISDTINSQIQTVYTQYTLYIVNVLNIYITRRRGGRYILLATN